VESRIHEWVYFVAAHSPREREVFVEVSAVRRVLRAVKIEERSFVAEAAPLDDGQELKQNLKRQNLNPNLNLNLNLNLELNLRLPS
jgi:hypothetical protein